MVLFLFKHILADATEGALEILGQFLALVNVVTNGTYKLFHMHFPFIDYMGHRSR